MKYSFLALALLLAACGSEQITVTTRAATLGVGRPAEPVPLQLLPINFLVVNKTNQADQLKLLISDNESFVGLGIRDYENLRINLSDVLRYVQQQQAVIKYYQTMTEPKAALDE
tara:strand:- start:51917 stop:52258 length:342 start_codon:yes stop_codon:yes gene_type:complete